MQRPHRTFTAAGFPPRCTALNAQFDFILERRFSSKRRADFSPANLNHQSIMFRAFKRVFIWLGLLAEQATETDAINQAVIERGIRDAKAKAERRTTPTAACRPDRAAQGSGETPGTAEGDLQGLLQAAAASNDEANGAHFAEELGSSKAN